ASARVAWVVSVLGMVIAAIIAIDMAARVLLGGSQPAMDEGIGLSVDVVGAFGVVMIVVGGLLSAIAAGALIKGFGRSAPLALAVGLVAIASWAGAVLARDFVGFFVAAQSGWLASIGAVALAAHSEREALNGSTRMIVTGGVSAALMLLGVGLVSSSINGI